VEYESRTHHTNMDVYERIQEPDMKQAATIMAFFAYQAAMRDGKFPRKPVQARPR
jgi:carboxypeptidase Q